MPHMDAWRSLYQTGELDNSVKLKEASNLLSRKIPLVENTEIPMYGREHVKRSERKRKNRKQRRF